MNFFDFELSRTASATPPETAVEDALEPTLNEEVTQVVGQLGKLWGGFRQQSQVALEYARKDFTSVVAQAQKEIGKLTNEPVASSSRISTEEGQGAGSSAPASSDDATADSPLSNEREVPRSSLSSESSPFQALLARVQSSLPPNISETLERNLPASLKDSGLLHVPSAADLAQLRATLGTEFARVQGVTRAQAEEYVHRSEALLKDAGEYIREAVKVIPPEEGGSGEADVVFDGMGVGVVMMPPSIGSAGPGNRDLSLGGRAKGKGRETAAQAQYRLAGSRAAAMLAQLKRDPEVIKQDPAEYDHVKELYEAWFKDEIESKEGGIESPYWVERAKDTLALSLKEDGDVLRATRDTLVPSSMDSVTFWTRYFFRVHQIEKDEEKRKELLAASGSTENDEDFSWEDDEDDSATPPITVSAGSTTGKGSASTVQGALDKARASSDTLQPTVKTSALASYPSSIVTSPSNTSPRESSDGYDVVSATSVADVKAKAPPVTKEAKEKEEDEEDEEDEEEDDEDDEDEEDEDEDEDGDEDEEGEEEGDSDWE